MAVSGRIITLMLLDLALALSIIISRLSSAKSTKEDVGIVTLIASDCGCLPRHTLRSLFEPARRRFQERLSLDAGSYTLGTNPLGRIFPRYIYFRDGSPYGFRISMVVHEDGTLELSVHFGNLKTRGVVYHGDDDTSITVSRGENFWIGQSEIKVR